MFPRLSVCLVAAASAAAPSGSQYAAKLLPALQLPSSPGATVRVNGTTGWLLVTRAGGRGADGCVVCLTLTGQDEV